MTRDHLWRREIDIAWVRSPLFFHWKENSEKYHQQTHRQSRPRTAKRTLRPQHPKYSPFFSAFSPIVSSKQNMERKSHLKTRIESKMQSRDTLNHLRWEWRLFVFLFNNDIHFVYILCKMKWTCLLFYRPLDDHHHHLCHDIMSGVHCCWFLVCFVAHFLQNVVQYIKSRGNAIESPNDSMINTEHLPLLALRERERDSVVWPWTLCQELVMSKLTSSLRTVVQF